MVHEPQLRVHLKPVAHARVRNADRMLNKQQHAMGDVIPDADAVAVHAQHKAAPQKKHECRRSTHTSQIALVVHTKVLVEGQLLVLLLQEQKRTNWC